MNTKEVKQDTLRFLGNLILKHSLDALCKTLRISYKNKKVIDSSLCSSCKNFDRSAVLCIKYDKHPTENYVPCDGVDWEPNS